ncbi:hypothetical protein D3C78_1440520 [compost metagenome]
MDVAVTNMVNTAVQMQQVNAEQDKQATILKKALEAQSSVMVELLQSVAQTPALASEGSLGTRINTYA